jgi:hypothetical protein
MQENFPVPPKAELKKLFSMAKIGDIISIRNYIIKIEEAYPETARFTARLKLLAKNIDLAEIEAILKKYIKE